MLFCLQPCMCVWFEFGRRFAQSKSGNKTKNENGWYACVCGVGFECELSGIFDTVHLVDWVLYKHSTHVNIINVSCVRTYKHRQFVHGRMQYNVYDGTVLYGANTTPWTSSYCLSCVLNSSQPILIIRNISVVARAYVMGWHGIRQKLAAYIIKTCAGWSVCVCLCVWKRRRVKRERFVSQNKCNRDDAQIAVPHLEERKRNQVDKPKAFVFSSVPHISAGDSWNPPTHTHTNPYLYTSLSAKFCTNALQKSKHCQSLVVNFHNLRHKLLLATKIQTLSPQCMLHCTIFNWN